MTYVRPSIDPDEDAIRQVVYTAIATAVPGWTPATSSFTTALLEAFIRIISEQRAVFADVPDSVFVALGESILGILRLAAQPAVGAVTFTLVDAAPAGGFVIPQGTPVAATAADGRTQIAFATTLDLVIAAGDTTGDAAVAALQDGSFANGITGDVVLLNGLAGVAPAGTLTAPTTGGVDEETLDAYLSRLVKRLKLLHAMPVSEADVSAFAELVMEEMGTPGLCLAQDGYDAVGNTTGNIKTIAAFLKDLTGQPQPSGTKTAVDAALQAARLQNFVFTVGDGLYTNIGVVANVVKEPSALSAQVQADVQAALAALLNPATWGSSSQEGDPSWTSRPVVKINDIIIAAGSVPGVRTVTSATLAALPGSPGSSDITMQSGKPQALPQAVGSGSTVTVNVS